MSARSKVRKVNYPKTQTPVLESEDIESVSREYYTYSDPDYEYILYSTSEKAKDFRDLRALRKKFVNAYGREEPSEQNSYNIYDQTDYRQPQDIDNYYIELKHEALDRDLSPVYPLYGTLNAFFNILDDYFFSLDASSNSLSLYYFVKRYLYFSEYVWPIVALYFPFLDYLSIVFALGWDGFLEQHLFICLFIFYCPFVFYIYFYFKLNSGDRNFVIPTFFCYFFVIFFTIFFFCIFLPITTVQTFLFVPGLLICAYLLGNRPVFPLVIDSYYDRPSFQNLLPEPEISKIRRKQICLPLYSYRYNWEYFPLSVNVNRPRKGPFAYPSFINVKSVCKHIRRLKRVKLIDSTLLSISAQNRWSSEKFPYLEPAKRNGFLLDQFPAGYAYAPTDHYFYSFEDKESSVDSNPEAEERPNDYIMEFITNELGLSNIRFFSAEDYHRIAFDHYSSVFSNSADTYNLLGPRAFSAHPSKLFGPYYKLALWLYAIRPSSETAGVNSASFTAILPLPYFFTKLTKSSGQVRTSGGFVSRIVVSILDFFYFSLLNKFFLYSLSFFTYKFNSRVPLEQTFTDFRYILFFYTIRASVFKELFRFLIFIDKGASSSSSCSASYISRAVLFLELHSLYLQLSLLSCSTKNSLFVYSRHRKLRYIKLCMIQIERILFRLRRS